MIIEKLPDKEKVGDNIRIGWMIYKVIARVSKWHLLFPSGNSYAVA